VGLFGFGCGLRGPELSQPSFYFVEVVLLPVTAFEDGFFFQRAQLTQVVPSCSLQTDYKDCSPFFCLAKAMLAQSCGFPTIVGRLGYFLVLA
jgi:hypothetical protein